MNDFKESLKVKEIIKQTKIQIRTDKELSNEQKREQLKALDRLKLAQDNLQRRSESCWEK